MHWLGRLGHNSFSNKQKKIPGNPRLSYDLPLYIGKYVEYPVHFESQN